MGFAALLFAMSGFGIAASIPDREGTINACFVKKGKEKGDLRVVAKPKCGKREKSIAFSQKGPAGPVGAAGPAGPTGPAGTDAQFSGAVAGGALSGTYPNPSFAAPEAVHIVGAPGEPVFTAGVSNSGSGTPPAEFYRDELERVHLSGTVNASIGNLFQLPTGYRPSAQRCFVVQAFAGANFVVNRVCLQASGNVNLSTGPGTTFIDLSPISIRAE